MIKHFSKTFGPNFTIGSLKLADLQRHVDARAKKRGIRNRPLSPTTIRKEIATLRAAWNWGMQAGLVTGPFPHRGLKFPKTTEKPPFRTWEEIEKQIETCQVTEAGQQDLWDCLYLTPTQIDELLAFVKANCAHGFVYPDGDLAFWV